MNFRVAANPQISAREGNIVVNDERVRVQQDGAPCRFEIGSTSQSMGPGGGTGTVTVTTLSGCSWNAASDATWIAITAGSSGNNSGDVTFQVSANSGADRSGTLTIAGQTVTITQTGSCLSSVNPTSHSVAATGGSAPAVTVTAQPGCAWTAASNATWITVTAGATGSGTGNVSFMVAGNSGAARTGTLTIAGQTVTVMQAGGCSSSIQPTSQSIGANGGNGTSVSVSAPNDCDWTAISNVAWITITSGASDHGDGTVKFTVAANSGAARTGTLTIAGQTFTVNQAAAPGPCLYSINPTSQSIGSSGGAGPSITVSAAAGCAWTASSNAAWISVTTGASGSGNGTVGFSVTANTGTTRTGMLTIAGQTFTVTQASGCSYSIDPTSQSIGSSGGNGTSIAVSTAAGCSWTAVSNAAWISVKSGSSGTGSGKVDFTVADNTGPARTGNLTVAGQTFTVSQATGCSYSISPTSQALSSSAQTGTPITVSTIAGCTWTAVSNVNWITITSGASGSGNGTVTFTVKSNAGGARTGTVTVAGRTFTVNQAKS